MLVMLIYWAEAYIHTIRENTDVLVVASKEIGLEVNADKTKYTDMSRDQNAGRNRNIKTDNSSFERVEQFKYWGTAVTSQNSNQEETESRLKSGNACYHLVQNLVSSRLLSKNLNIRIYITIILPVVFYGCETWSLILTLRRLMSYIYMEHPFLMFLDHTQRRTTVGRTPLDE